MWWGRLHNHPEGSAELWGLPTPRQQHRMGTELPLGLVPGGVGDREQCSCPGGATSAPPDVWSILERWAERKDSWSLASSAVFLSWFPVMLLGCISAMGRDEGAAAFFGFEFDI